MVAAVTQFGEAGNRSLQTVRTLLTDPVKMEAVIKMMSTSEAANGMIARLGNQLTYYKDKELASVLTTTNRFLRFLDTLAVAESTKASTFDPKELQRQDDHLPGFAAGAHADAVSAPADVDQRVAGEWSGAACKKLTRCISFWMRPLRSATWKPLMTL